MSDDDLGPLPTLKAYTLTGPAYFAVQSLVLIRIQDTKDTMGVEGGGLAQRCMLWALNNRILAVKYLTSGGGYFEALFNLEDAEKISAWLVEHGGQDQSLV